jgi:hypothetical protein
MGRHHDVVSRFARQETSWVSYDLLAEICAVLECRPGDLLAYDPDPQEQIPLFERPAEAGILDDANTTTMAGNAGDGPHER